MPRLGFEVANRRRISSGLAFWVIGTMSLLMLFASGAASPLYRVYQAQWGFSAITLTTVFAVYVLALLLTLLFLGGLSDYVGRRPVLLAGLTIQAAACLVFLSADGVMSLYIARTAQGIAVGLTASAIGATLVELRADDLAPLVSTSAPNLGLATGALAASALVEYAPAPTHLVWILILASLAVASPMLIAMPETHARRPGAVASLRPQIQVPAAARGTFAATLPAIVAVWALGGLYLALGPSLAAQLEQSQNLLWGGLVIFLLTSVGALASAASRRHNAVEVMRIGCLALILGVLVTTIAIANTSAVLFLGGTAIAGLGFGPAFTGAYRAIVAQANPEDRGGLIAAIFIATYTAFGAPVVLAGFATQHVGLDDTALAYSICVIVLAGAALASLTIRGITQPASRPAGPSTTVDIPPGPCTVPPCPRTT